MIQQEYPEKLYKLALTVLAKIPYFAEYKDYAWIAHDSVEFCKFIEPMIDDIGISRDEAYVLLKKYKP